MECDPVRNFGKAAEVLAHADPPARDRGKHGLLLGGETAHKGRIIEIHPDVRDARSSMKARARSRPHWRRPRQRKQRLGKRGHRVDRLKSEMSDAEGEL